MKNDFKGGAWPVMLTPFLDDKSVDYEGLKALTNWYIDNGCSGLFAVCQSSEMFFLSLDERIKIAKTVVDVAANRVPVIASGHISDSIEDQIDELNAMASTNIDALILITNRFAKEDEDDLIWRNNLIKVIDNIKSDIPLGMYECPFPYKHLISDANLEFCAKTNRFFFLKDTCCDLEILKRRIKITENTNMKIYNANTTTLLDSLKEGCTGYSGVMASFQMKLYAFLCENYKKMDLSKLQSMLTVTSLIERQFYPINAKYYLNTFENLNIKTISRVKDSNGLTPVFKTEVQHLKELSDFVCKSLNIN